MREIRIDYLVLGFSVTYLIDDSLRYRSSLKGVKFEACGDSRGESVVISIIRHSGNPTKRKKVMRIEGNALVLDSKDRQHPITLRIPEGVFPRALKLLIQGREQYRNMRVLAKISWAKELTLMSPQ